MTIHTQSGSPFFAIPGGIREAIYTYYLTFHFRDIKLSGRPCFWASSDQPFSKPLPALMLSCKRAYHEMRPKVHEEAVMIACMFMGSSRKIGFAVHGNLRISRLRKLVFLVATDRSPWVTWMGFLRQVTGRAEGLRELVVDWEPRWTAVPGSTEEWGLQETRKVKRMFEVIDGAPALEVVTIHGDIPSDWLDELRVMIANKLDRVVKVKCLIERWSMEGRDDLGMQKLTGQAQ
ncbi:hypothetical protein VMCG_07825 [Cytospora schulzeri]|uniref:Uncharacterized protein n=1 Tax=Cytospora schulzeri TaxID=448051 RepID=A0A423VZS4_9PEZI|nr:hypothetical protein VMCG_07825 [Valsa malicola]